jgi:RimJ/RimL family protein N-acetyltransferase
MTTLSTERLLLRLPTAGDAPFIVRLLNDPAWLQHIGDRGVRTEADARAYITDRLLDSFRRHGLGLWVVEQRSNEVPLGLCGLLKRETLDDVDIGFAFLPEARGLGIAQEAARCTLQHASASLGLRRIVAIASPGNFASARLLQRLGLSFERVIDQGHDHPLHLYAIEFPAARQEPGR